jgi:hypothetical protein
MSQTSVWLLKIGEYLPIDGGEERLMRMGLIADALRARNCVVTWWATTYDHLRKRYPLNPRATLREEHLGEASDA